jgi:hypothetical protein
MAKPRAAARSGGDTTFRIEADEFGTLMRDAKAFDRDLGLRLRRNIRDAAKPIVADVRRKVLEPPPGDRPGTAGTREAIARGVGLKIATGTKGGAVTIAASARALPANRRSMLRAYNQKQWRHPTFGNRNVWQTQQGNPYFGATVLAHREQLRKAVEDALNQAAAALGRTR